MIASFTIIQALASKSLKHGVLPDDIPGDIPKDEIQDDLHRKCNKKGIFFTTNIIIAQVEDNAAAMFNSTKLLGANSHNGLQSFSGQLSTLEGSSLFLGSGFRAV